MNSREDELREDELRTMNSGTILAANVCLRDAWPAPEWVEVGGWRLRAARGGYNRVNSVWPAMFDGSVGVETAIDRVEAFYREHGLPACFQVLENAQPSDLDARLDRRGYGRRDACFLMTKAVSAGVSAGPGISASDAASTDWLDVYLPAQSPAKADELPGILERLTGPRAFLVAEVDGAPGAVALAGRSGADVAVDCVQTAPRCVRRGGAMRVMRAAESWAASVGASRLVLYVLATNAAALKLYERLGYRVASGYHYRFRSDAP